MLLHGLALRRGFLCRGLQTTSNLPFQTLRSFRPKPVRTSVEVGAVENGARVDVGLRDDEQAFELPSRLFEQLPFAIYVCDRDGLVLRYNRRAAELWGAF